MHALFTDLTSFPKEIVLANGKVRNPWKRFAAGKVALCALTALDFFPNPLGLKLSFTAMALFIHGVNNTKILHDTKTLAHQCHNDEDQTFLHGVISASYLSDIICSSVVLAVASDDQHRRAESQHVENLLKIAFITMFVGFSVIAVSLVNMDRFHPLKLNGQPTNL